MTTHLNISPQPSLTSHCTDIVGVRAGELFPKITHFQPGEAITLRLPDSDSTAADELLGSYSIPADRLNHDIPLQLSEYQTNSLKNILRFLYTLSNEFYKQEKQPIKTNHKSTTYLTIHSALLDLPPNKLKSFPLTGIAQTCTYSYHLAFCLDVPNYKQLNNQASILLSSLSHHPHLPMSKLLRSGVRTACHSIAQHLNPNNFSSTIPLPQ